MLAETLSFGAIRSLTGFDFCSPIAVGPATGEFNSLTHLKRVPIGKNGIYMVWVSIGGRSPIPIYCGKCAAKGDGIRFRIYKHFNKNLNTDSMSGCFLVDKYLKESSQTSSFYVTYAVFEPEVIDAKERSMLNRIDFIANDQHNGARRLGALEAFFRAAEPEAAPEPAPAPAPTAAAAEPEPAPEPTAATAPAVDYAAEIAALRAEVERLAAAEAGRAAHRKSLREKLALEQLKLKHLMKAEGLFAAEIEKSAAAIEAMTSELMA
jgi:hypothetical protein